MALIEPPVWNSVHREISYRWTYPSFISVSAGPDADGNLTLVIGFTGLTVGQRVIIPSGIYEGAYGITASYTSGGIHYITLNTPYVSGTAIPFIPLSNVNVELWAGYDSSHEGFTDIPLQKIADVVGVPGVNAWADIKVQGFLKSLFKKIEAPRIGVDWRMSSPFYVVIDGTTYNTHYCINGTFESTPLNNLNNPYEILNARTPLFFKNSRTIYSMIQKESDPRGGHIRNIVATTGTPTGGLGLGFDEIGTTFTVA